MKPVDCEFESEVLAAIVQGRWPDRVDAGLARHAAGCAICSDVAAVAGAIEDARQEGHACAVIPDSGRVWWLAQLRARREAAQAAGRPITAAQVIAFACAIGLLGACFGATSTWFQSALQRVGSSLLPDVVALIAGHGVLIAGVAAVLLLVPAAVCFAMFRD